MTPPVSTSSGTAHSFDIISSYKPLAKSYGTYRVPSEPKGGVVRLYGCLRVTVVHESATSLIHSFGILYGMSKSLS